MNDFFRFAVRGALGGSLAPVLLFTCILLVTGFNGYIFGIGIAFVLGTLPEGAVVGLLLCFLGSRAPQVLKLTTRILSGGAVSIQMILLSATTKLIHFVIAGTADLSDFRVNWIWYMESILVGAFAGLACPSKLLFSRQGRRSTYQHRLTYRERVLFDEQAEQEARLAREKNNSEDGRQMAVAR